MIAKDEAPIIRQSLDSVVGFVDFVLVVDTGSIDGTPDVVQEWLAKNSVPGRVVRSEWKDFAWNRTHALAELRSHHDIDYAFVLDADDILVRDEDFNVEEFKSGLTADIYDIPIRFKDLRFSRPQLLRNAKAFGFKGVLHEFVEPPVDWRGRLSAQGLYVQAHSRGARSRNPNKYHDDIRALEQALQLEQEIRLRARYLFYLAQSYNDTGDFQRALELYDERAGVDFWPDEMFVAAYRAAKLRERLSCPEPEIEEAFKRAIQIMPDRLEAYHGLSRFYRMRGRYEEAYSIGRRGISRGASDRDGLFVDSRIYNYRLLEEAALSAYLTGNLQEAAVRCEAVLKRDSVPERTRMRLLRCLQSARKARFKRAPKVAAR